MNHRFLLYRLPAHPIAMACAALLAAAVVGCSGSSPAPNGAANRAKAIELLNVSYDPTRELYRDINAAFAKHYEQEHGTPVSIKQSHAASGSQSRAVIDGLDADVVTLATWPDVEAIAKSGLLREDWQNRYENGSIPYHSVVVFVVRKGNPKKIADWPDLDRDDIAIITPNPKTSGNGKYSFLAAWGAALAAGGGEEDAQQFVSAIYRRTPVLDTGARAATATFSQKGIGDVHLTFEQEAHLEVDESKGDLEIVYPKRLSLLPRGPGHHRQASPAPMGRQSPSAVRRGVLACDRDLRYRVRRRRLEQRHEEILRRRGCVRRDLPAQRGKIAQP